MERLCPTATNAGNTSSNLLGSDKLKCIITATGLRERRDLKAIIPENIMHEWNRNEACIKKKKKKEQQITLLCLNVCLCINITREIRVNGQVWLWKEKS